jgi:hypothetical protein
LLRISIFPFNPEIRQEVAQGSIRLEQLLANAADIRLVEDNLLERLRERLIAHHDRS